MKLHKHGLDRREFVKTSTAAAAAFSIIPSRVLGNQAPSNKINIAAIGAGGKGRTNITRSSSQNLIAFADVDDERAAKTYQEFPGVPTFRDFRKMLDKHEKDIDAVLISTPDHMHAYAAMECMRRGKHVYVEKPLTHDVFEARKMTEAANKYGVITQMGNQGHSGEGIRQICEWIWAGVIGEVREAHAWTNRPLWPQGFKEPAPKEPVPGHLSWDLWLGTAPWREYNKAYVPWNWRGWWDYGTGALGDMACHIVDPIFWALKLKYPVSVVGSSTPTTDQSFPWGSVIRFEYPEREGLAPVKLSWWDGGMLPPRPDELEDDRILGDRDGGCLFVGSKGKIMCGCYGKDPCLLPEKTHKEFLAGGVPEPTLPRIEGGIDAHQMDWINNIKAGTKPSSNFDYAGPLSESILMGNLSLKYQGQVLNWDGAAMKYTNNEEASKYVKRVYREGWEMEGLS